jgi:hypothetical protein
VSTSRGVRKQFVRRVDELTRDVRDPELLPLVNDLRRVADLPSVDRALVLSERLRDTEIRGLAELSGEELNRYIARGGFMDRFLDQLPMLRRNLERVARNG